MALLWVKNEKGRDEQLPYAFFGEFRRKGTKDRLQLMSNLTKG